MKRFLVISAFAMAFAFATSTKAHAQLSYAYSLPSNGGIEYNQGSLGYSPSNSTSFYSPFTGLMNQTTGSVNSLFGGRANYSSFSSPFTGSIQQTNRVVPTPFGTITYSTYNSPYTGFLQASKLTTAGTPPASAFTGLQYNYASGLYGYNVPSQAANPLAGRHR
jgi:hypothetical protein